MQSDPPYAISRTVQLPFDQVDQRVREALGGEGFGILTEIDVRTTLRKKLDVDFPRYCILGACSPRMAHQAILCEADVGLLLPCNVIVREVDERTTVVAALDPVTQLRLAANAALEPLAAEVRDRLARALARAAGD
jgi:uncharacterized protein (DUF302 family)